MKARAKRQRDRRQGSVAAVAERRRCRDTRIRIEIVG
jgi:hypothetical protein